MVTFFLGVAIVLILALQKSNNKTEMFHFLLANFIGGLIGARLFYIIVFRNFGLLESISFFFDFSISGLASFGALLGIISASFIYSRYKDIWKLLDIASAGMMLGLIAGRIGCYLAGCCYGKETSVPWAIEHKDMLRHPAQLYDIVNAFVVYFIVRKQKHAFPGSFFLMTVALYSIFRVFVEFFRTGPGLWIFTHNQIAYFVVFTVALWIFLRKRP